MIFTRQLATLIDAGLPLLRGLTVLAKQEKDPVLQKTINALADAVQSGSTFSESMAQHPLVFNKLYINMVKAGELGGVLELVLNRLAEFQEKAEKIKNKVVAAMFYPVAVLIIAILIMVFLMAFIVPKFQAIFKDMLGNKPLPPITEWVIFVSNVIQEMFCPAATSGTRSPPQGCFSPSTNCVPPVPPRVAPDPRQGQAPHAALFGDPAPEKLDFPL